jgi:hypothetical protein
MNRSWQLAVGFCIVLTASPAFAQSRGGGGGGGNSFGSSGSSGFGSSSGGGSGADISGGFGSNTQGGFGDTSQFGQTTGMNALSSGIGSPAVGLGLPPLNGSMSGSSRSGGSGSSSSRGGGSSSFGSTTSSRGGSGGGLANGRSSGSSSRSSSRSVTGMTGNRSPGRNSGGFGMNGMAGMNGGMGRNGMSRGGGIGVQQAVRPVIQIGFDDMPQALQPPVVAQSISTSFAQNTVMPQLAQMKVNIDANGFATVQGTAKTNRERIMAAALLSLEPGVRGVRNEVSVPPIASLPASR